MEIVLNNICLLLALLTVGTEIVSSQSELKAIVEKIASCNERSERAADISDLKVVKIGRASVAIDGKVITKYDIPEGTTFDINLYRLSMGKWTLIPLNLQQLRFCQILQKMKVYTPTLLERSDLPKRCPIPKGEYKFDNATLTINKVPSYVPKGCFKAEVLVNVQEMKQAPCFYGVARIAGPGESAGSCIHQSS